MGCIITKLELSHTTTKLELAQQTMINWNAYWWLNMPIGGFHISWNAYWWLPIGGFCMLCLLVASWLA